MNNSSLIDRDELYKMFPAFKGHGKNPHSRVNWLIRTRQISGMVRIGRRIFFNPETIKEWIERNAIPQSGG